MAETAHAVADLGVVLDEAVAVEESGDLRPVSAHHYQLDELLDQLPAGGGLIWFRHRRGPVRHGVPRHRLVGPRLTRVPVFDDLAVRHSPQVASHDRDGTEPVIQAMHHDQFVLAEGAQPFMAEAGRKAARRRAQSVEARPGERRVLDVARRPGPVDSAEVAVAEQFGRCVQHEVLRGHWAAWKGLPVPVSPSRRRLSR